MTLEISFIKSPLRLNKSNVENMSQSSRFKIIQQCGLHQNNDVNVKENKKFFDQNLTNRGDQNCLISSTDCANR